MVLALLAPFFFPILFTLFLAVLGAWAYAGTPLLVGILLDALYWSGAVYPFPLYTLLGILATIVTLLVRRFFKTSIMHA